MDTPLHIDEETENLEGSTAICRLNSFVQRFFPRFALVTRRRGRRSIETQLAMRTSFDAVAWNAYGAAEQVVAITKILQTGLDLPNHHLIPDDPFVLLMNTSTGFDDVFTFDEIESKYRTTYSKEDYRRIRSEEWTVGQFVEDLLNRCSGPANS